jgi:adenosine deaminase
MCHLSAETCRPLSNMKRLGLLNERLVAAHMTQLTNDEVDAVAAAQSSVVHCPTSNLKLASGICRVSDLLARGVNVAIGTDGAASNNTLNMFAEMKLAAILAKAESKQCTRYPRTRIHDIYIGLSQTQNLVVSLLLQTVFSLEKKMAVPSTSVSFYDRAKPGVCARVHT